MQTAARQIIVIVSILMLARLLPADALAADAETQACPQPISGGVVCTGPTVPPSYLPILQVNRLCPQAVGEGVICTGPEVPTGDAPVEAQISTAPIEVGLYLPMLNR